MKRTVAIFVKPPVAGRVKTRLAETLGYGRAASLYRYLSLKTMAHAKEGPWRTLLAVDSFSRAQARLFLSTRLPLISQGSGDLGKRIDRVFAKMPAGPVVIIGSDVPGLRSRHISEAFKALTAADAVFGPSLDGGFWLIGIRRVRSGDVPLDGVRWSSEHALEDAIRSLPRAWRIAIISPLADIDTSKDLAAAGSRAFQRAVARQ